MMTCGDGSVSLWKYQYPDQRKIKVCVDRRSLACLDACWPRVTVAVAVTSHVRSRQ
jgi:hypothetical protein